MFNNLFLNPIRIGVNFRSTFAIYKNQNTKVSISLQQNYRARCILFYFILFLLHSESFPSCVSIKPQRQVSVMLLFQIRKCRKRVEEEINSLEQEQRRLLLLE